MKKHLILTAALIAATFSMNSFAYSSSTSINAGVATTKAEAYAQGHELLAELNQASSFELSQEFSTFGRGSDYAIEDGVVKVSEVSNESGATEYKTTVDVKYSFDARS